ncbi:sugar ABC transporter substrate-binding protein [Streptomyces sp. TRM66268-LWL]|uniref:Sugar ABC transporter substrate-binding protein n=1 Tax=Streptomyces polyasparticus TaxID=2767826 RepID=A0ABR7SEP8_9ACTN|nr:sugar ABC transporter substrate-binding protein [Streptomyces polyasparticus]MBC9712931.1 sugar ABC transporter substrate-binding protein [Streptomyces polyasparticus]
MRISRRAATATAFAVTSALVMTACGGTGSGGDGNSESFGKVEGTVKFQTWNLKTNFKDYFEGVIDGFEKKYPDVEVEWIDQPAEGYADKLSADATAGTLPDVVNVAPDLATPLAKAGLALNLDEDPAAAKFKDEYLEGAWKGHEMPGKKGTYAFPWYLNTGPMFYNKALFKDAGLDPEKPPTSYDQLFADSLKMARNSKGKIAMLSNAPAIEDFGRYGVELMNADKTKFTFNDAKGVELVEKYKELFDKGALDEQALTAVAESSGRKFQQGQIAMNPGGAHDLETYKKEAPSLYENIGITPAVNNTGKDNMYVQGLMVNAQSKVKPAAIEFAHWVTNAANQEEFGRQVAIFPSTKGSLDSDFYTKDDGTDEGRVRVAAAQALKTAVNYTPVVFTEQMKTVLKNEVAKAMQGKKSAKQAMDDAVAECDKLLQQAG